jgi:outer membrane protein insertion porin family
MFSSAAHAAIVNHVVITGNQRIEQSAIETYLGIAPGGDVSVSDLDQGLKRLYDTGFFSDVTLDINGDALNVRVEENPSINEVVFEGNAQLEKEDLEKEVTLRSRSIYTRTKVQNDLKRLLDVYRRNGRYSANITPKLIPLEQNRVNLVFEINEGPEALIRKITFISNKAFSTTDLRKVLSSEETRWYKFLSGGDRYDPDRLQYDQELLRKFYSENGYADFKVTSAIAELSPQRDAFYLTFTVDEGEPYTFGNIDVASSLARDKDPVPPEAISTKKGDDYNSAEVQETVDRMVEALGDKGYAFVDINPKLQRRGDNSHIMDLTYEIKEGPRVYVERINIFGNQRTLDEVVRREFRLTEGDAYSSTKLDRTEQRLNNLGFFEKVDIKESPGSTPDKTQIDVEVAEKSTGEITIGAGFSTSDGALADFGMRERNFLGQGQDIRLRTVFAARRQQYDIGITEPYFLGRELEAGFDLFNSNVDLEDEASFDRGTTGGRLRLGYGLTEKWRHNLRYSYEKIDIDNVQANASRFIKDQQGSNTTSMFGHSLVYDARDNRFTPNKGLYLNLSQDFAGLGGDDTFLRHQFQSEYYLPLAKQWVLAFAGTAGHIAGLNDDVRINQRFFIGSKEIRGFRTAGIGPRDTTTKDALGANSFYAGSVEMRFPLGLPDDLGVSGALFNDMGSAFGIDQSGIEIGDESSLRAAAGFGIAWSSPFGPIRIDFSHAYLKESYDEDELVRFSFGTRF